MTRWWGLACVPALLMVLTVAGCSDTNPMIKLRRAGVVIQQDDEREKIERVVLPKSASADQLEQQLKDLAEVPRVLELDLSGTQINDSHLELLGSHDELETLDLSGTAITSEGLPELAKLTSLRKLTLSNTRVTNDGLAEHIPEFPALKTLELSRSRKPVRDVVVDTDEGLLETIFSGIKLGIDLAGGANLILEVDEKLRQQQGKELTPDVMSQMATAINKRANPGGNKELTVRPLGTNRIEVIIPKADPQVVEQTKRMMTRLGSLELAILANTRDAKFESLVRKARELPEDQSQVITLVGAAGDQKSQLDGEWLPIDPNGEVDGSYDVLVESRLNLQGVEVDHVLVAYGTDNQRVKGEHLYRVYQTNDDNGRLAVGFTLNIGGGNR
ncbi:MAG: hypothetical protein VX311_02650, partial [Planctomycetota bacterium]|nr:hypothetical protein [Planctomycetota bacterium]